MTSELALRLNRPVAVLEVGGGTGSITEVIARQLSAGDRLDVYEINAAMAGVIRHRLIENPRFRRSGIDIRVYVKAIEDIDPAPLYDYVISCLPFTNLEADVVQRILEIYRALLKPAGVCSFYEYILLRRAAQLIRRDPRERRRVRGVEHVVQRYRDCYCYKQDMVLRNLPPAMVYHLCFDGGKA
jgi:phospholipid N-methyltransferase